MPNRPVNIDEIEARRFAEPEAGRQNMAKHQRNRVFRPLTDKQRAARYRLKKRLAQEAADRDTRDAKPPTELLPVGPHAHLPGRDALGHWTKENSAQLKTGVHSAKHWAGLGPQLQADRIEVLAARGFSEEDADPVFKKLVDAFSQAVVMMNSSFDYLTTTGGPITPKGNSRKALETWSRAADRVHKFGVALGLERRARRVTQSPREWLESLPHKNNTDNETQHERAERTDD